MWWLRRDTATNIVGVERPVAADPCALWGYDVIVYGTSVVVGEKDRSRKRPSMHTTGAIPGHVGAASVARQRKKAAATAQVEALRRAEAAARLQAERDSAFLAAKNAAAAEQAEKEMEFLMLEDEFAEADRAADRAARQSMAAIAALNKVLPSAAAAATAAVAASNGVVLDSKNVPGQNVPYRESKVHADYVAAAARMAKTEQANNVLALKTNAMPLSPHAGVTVTISNAGHRSCNGEYVTSMHARGEGGG